jgi:hypothetical protein
VSYYTWHWFHFVGACLAIWYSDKVTLVHVV